MEAKLVVVSGAARPSEFKLKLPTIIGRSRTVDLPVGHPLVSRQHCELFAEEEVLKIRDLGSLNGTFVRETRIAEDTVLEPGDEFSVGPLTFKAVYGKMPAAAPADDDLSPPEAKESEPEHEHGPPPAFDDDEPVVGLTAVEAEEVAAPADEAAAPSPAGELGEDDFMLADAGNAGFDTEFDSVVFIPQPAAPRRQEGCAKRPRRPRLPKPKLPSRLLKLKPRPNRRQRTKSPRRKPPMGRQSSRPK